MDRFEVQNLRRHEGGKHLCLFAGRRKSDEKEGMGRQGKEGRRLEGGWVGRGRRGEDWREDG